VIDVSVRFIRMQSIRTIIDITSLRLVKLLDMGRTSASTFRGMDASVEGSVG